VIENYAERGEGEELKRKVFKGTEQLRKYLVCYMESLLLQFCEMSVDLRRLQKFAIREQQHSGAIDSETSG
jgi:hypothetical protein